MSRATLAAAVAVGLVACEPMDEIVANDVVIDRGLVWAPDGQEIFYVRFPDRLEAARLDDGASRVILERAAGAVRPLAVSRDGRVLYFEEPDGYHGISLETGRRMSLDGGAGGGLLPSPDSRSVAYLSAARELLLFEVATASVTPVAGSSAGPVAFSPDSRVVAYRDLSGSLCLHDRVAGGSPVRVPGCSRVLAIASDGGELLCFDDSPNPEALFHAVTLSDRSMRPVVGSLGWRCPFGRGQPRTHWSADGYGTVTICDGGIVYRGGEVLWEAERGETAQIRREVLSSNGRRLAFAVTTSECTNWDWFLCEEVRTRSHLHVLDLDVEEVTYLELDGNSILTAAATMTFSDDARALAYVAANGALHVLRL
jgi:hypothetical protein